MTEQDLKFKIESYCKRKRNVKTKKNNIKAKGEAYENAMSYPSDAEVIYYFGESASHCRRLAKEADVVVIVAGNDYLDEGECVANESVDVTAVSYTHLTLPTTPVACRSRWSPYH